MLRKRGKAPNVREEDSEEYDAVILTCFRTPERYALQLRLTLEGLKMGGIGRIGIRKHPQENTFLPGLAEKIAKDFPGTGFLPPEPLLTSLHRGKLLLHFQSTAGLEVQFLKIPCICVLDPELPSDWIQTGGFLGHTAYTAQDIARLIKNGISVPNDQPWTTPPKLCYGTVRRTRKDGRVVEVIKKLVFRTLVLLASFLAESTASKTINTSFVERNNGTDRGQNARKRRKTY